jgi:hypothetical protein
VQPFKLWEWLHVPWGASAELLPHPKPHTRPIQASLIGALRLRCSTNFAICQLGIWHHFRRIWLLTSSSHGALAGQTNGEVEGPRDAARLEPRAHNLFQRPRRH